MVRDRIGPVAFFKTALVVPRLPKTRSGKILRGTMQKIADGQPWKMPATIDDPAALDEITGGLKTAGCRRISWARHSRASATASLRRYERAGGSRPEHEEGIDDSRHQPPRSHGGRGRNRRHGPRHRAGDGAGRHQGASCSTPPPAVPPRRRRRILDTLKGLVAKGRLTDADVAKTDANLGIADELDGPQGLPRRRRGGVRESRSEAEAVRRARGRGGARRASWRRTPRRSASPRSRAR